MKIGDIPFNRHISILTPEEEDGVMSLHFTPEMTNHLGTIHASAQFALAEACSGQFLLNRFPEYVDGYAAVLRKSDVKYKRQTYDNIHAMANVEEETVKTFKDRLDRRHRSVLPIRVTIKDEEENITMDGTFEWYVQKTQGEALRRPSPEGFMFKVIRNGTNRLDITMNGKLDAVEMRTALDELVGKSEDITRGKMLYDVVDFHLPSLSAIAVELSRLPSMLGLLKKFDRAAVLADRTWLKKVSELEGALVPGLEIKAFDRNQKAAAEAWLSR